MQDCNLRLAKANLNAASPTEASLIGARRKARAIRARATSPSVTRVDKTGGSAVNAIRPQARVSATKGKPSGAVSVSAPARDVERPPHGSALAMIHHATDGAIVIAAQHLFGGAPSHWMLDSLPIFCAK